MTRKELLYRDLVFDADPAALCGAEMREFLAKLKTELAQTRSATESETKPASKE